VSSEPDFISFQNQISCIKACGRSSNWPWQHCRCCCYVALTDLNHEVKVRSSRIHLRECESKIQRFFERKSSKCVLGSLLWSSKAMRIGIGWSCYAERIFLKDNQIIIIFWNSNYKLKRLMLLYIMK